MISKSFYFYSAGYALITTFLRWRLSPDLSILLYLVGAVIGIHLIVVLEKLLKTQVFRSIMVQGLLYIVVFFVISSSNNLFGKGVVIFTNFWFWLVQQQEYRKTGKLTTWTQTVNLDFSSTLTRNYFWALNILLLIQTVLFIIV